jgi:hypothetical protein
MIWFYLIIAIPIGYYLIKWWIKLVNYVFKGVIPEKHKVKSSQNPYIKAHQMRKYNDESYDEYLNWLDKNGGDMPIDKVKSKEEQRFEKQWKRY